MTEPSPDHSPARDKPPSRPVPRRPPGYRTSQVTMPKRLYELARAQAYMLGTPWNEFMVKLLTEATADLSKAKPET